MVTQYPHTITVKSVAESVQDSDGNFQSATPSSFDFSGRFETNRNGNFVTAANGQQIVYSGIIYAPFSTQKIALGTDIEVKDGTDPISKGNVIQFSRGQLNVRIWI